MATYNKTREGTRNQKKGVCVAAIPIDYNDVGDIAAVAELAEIPEDAFILASHLNVKTAFNAGTSITLAIKLGATTILAAVSVATAGIKTSSATKADSGAGAKLTSTAVVVGALPTAGKAMLMVEYIEYNKNTGEYTDYSTT